MSDALISFFQAHNLSSEIIIFIISLFPILELRGGLIAAAILKVPTVKAFLICFIANIIPVPFILLFIKQIFKILKKVKFFEKIVIMFENKALRKKDAVTNKRFVGLFFLVAIPLPGTGAWTGSLVAAIMDMPIKKSFITISIGVFCAGIIMLILTYFIPGLFGFGA